MADDCKTVQANLKRCNCSYDPCPRKGQCCLCIQSHVSKGELPACCFPDDVERTFDRSMKRFAQLVQSGVIG